MAHTLAVACVDNEKRDEPFFASADEIMASPEVGGDGIAYLFEQHGLWQDQCSIATKDLTVDQVIGILLSEAERPENAGESPFSRMRASTRESFLRITASLFLPLLTDRSRYGSTDDSSSSESSTSSEKPPAADEG